MVEGSIVVNVPVIKVYGEWLHVEDYPYFLSGIRRVEDLGNGQLIFEGAFGRVCSVHVYDQVSEKSLCWRSLDTPYDFKVTFEALNGCETRVTVRINTDFSGVRLQDDLENFKSFIERAYPAIEASEPAGIKQEHFVSPDPDLLDSRGSCIWPGGRDLRHGGMCPHSS